MLVYILEVSLICFGRLGHSPGEIGLRKMVLVTFTMATMSIMLALVMVLRRR